MKTPPRYVPPMITDPIAEASRRYANAHGDGTIGQAQALQRAFNAGARLATDLASPLMKAARK